MSTADLTRSFGWDQYGALMQEDVHEFNKILCDALEEKMKASALAPSGLFMCERGLACETPHWSTDMATLGSMRLC